MGGLLAFFGGSAFRMLWGEVFSFLDKRREHAQELERMRLCEQFDEAKHRRNLEAQELQAKLGVQVIRAESDAVVEGFEAKAWADIVQSTGKPIGVKWVDAWNAAIRPAGATWAFALLTLEAFAVVTITSGTLEVCWAYLGLFVADRIHVKRRK